MTDPTWPALFVMLIYVSVGVVLGVASNRIGRTQTALLLLITSTAMTAVTAWPRSVRAWHERVTALATGFGMTWFFFAALLLIPFALGRYAARVIVRRRQR